MDPELLNRQGALAERKVCRTEIVLELIRL